MLLYALGAVGKERIVHDITILTSVSRINSCQVRVFSPFRTFE